MIPDAEKIVTAYLVAATGERIVGDTPENLDAPWVRLTQLDAANDADSRAEHLIDYMLQLECYAGSEGGHSEAHEVAVGVRQALAGMEGAHGGVVVTAVRFAGMSRIPDTAMEPARQRYILTTHVFIHP